MDSYTSLFDKDNKDTVLAVEPRPNFKEIAFQLIWGFTVLQNTLKGKLTSPIIVLELKNANLPLSQYVVGNHVLKIDLSFKVVLKNPDIEIEQDDIDSDLVKISDYLKTISDNKENYQEILIKTLKTPSYHRGYGALAYLFSPIFVVENKNYWTSGGLIIDKVITFDKPGVKKEIKDKQQKKLKEAEERKAKEEADKKAKEEADKKAKEEADKKAKEEAERKAKEEAERKAKEEAERKVKEEAEQKKKEEVERKRKEEEAEKQKKEAEEERKEEAEKTKKKPTEIVDPKFIAFASKQFDYFRKKSGPKFSTYKPNVNQWLTDIFARATSKDDIEKLNILNIAKDNKVSTVINFEYNVTKAGYANPTKTVANAGLLIYGMYALLYKKSLDEVREWKNNFDKTPENELVAYIKKTTPEFWGTPVKVEEEEVKEEEEEEEPEAKKEEEIAVKKEEPKSDTEKNLPSDDNDRLNQIIDFASRISGVLNQNRGILRPIDNIIKQPKDSISFISPIMHEISLFYANLQKSDRDNIYNVLSDKTNFFIINNQYVKCFFQVSKTYYDLVVDNANIYADNRIILDGGNKNPYADKFLEVVLYCLVLLKDFASVLNKKRIIKKETFQVFFKLIKEKDVKTIKLNDFRNLYNSIQNDLKNPMEWIELTKAKLEQIEKNQLYFQNGQYDIIKIQNELINPLKEWVSDERVFKYMGFDKPYILTNIPDKYHTKYLHALSHVASMILENDFSSSFDQLEASWPLQIQEKQVFNI